MCKISQVVSISDKILSFTAIEQGSEPIMITYVVPEELVGQYTIKNNGKSTYTVTN